MTPEELAIRRMRDYKYHVEKCEANNLSPMDWPTYKYLYYDSKDTAEENHQRAEELMFKRNLRNMKRMDKSDVD